MSFWMSREMRRVLGICCAPLAIASYFQFRCAGMSSSSVGLGAPSQLLLMRKFKGRRPRKREPKEGDWVCQCGEVNYRVKRECFKCGAPAPPLPPGVKRPSLPGEDPNDWACPCGQMNFRGNVTCYKCSQPKAAPPVDPANAVTMWSCKKCKGVNRSTRKFCFKCGSPPPVPS